MIVQEEHQHPQSGEVVCGLQLAPGAILRESDKYDSSTGHWEECPTPGITLQTTPTTWVRPDGLSQNGKYLVMYLASNKKGLFDTVGYRGCWMVVPCPDRSKWDPRIQMPPVAHPECIRELEECGFLTFDDTRQVGVLNAAGREYGERLLRLFEN